MLNWIFVSTLQKWLFERQNTQRTRIFTTDSWWISRIQQLLESSISFAFFENIKHALVFRVSSGATRYSDFTSRKKTHQKLDQSNSQNRSVYKNLAEWNYRRTT